jgi:hypothetical protein
LLMLGYRNDRQTLARLTLPEGGMVQALAGGLISASPAVGPAHTKALLRHAHDTKIPILC